MHRQTVLFLLQAILLCLCGSLAFAQESPLIERGDVLSARNLLSTTRGYGTANVMVASASGTAALWHNPAGISQATMFTVDGSYLYDDQTKGHGFQVNILDSKTNQYVSAAMGLLYEYGKPEDKQHLINTRIGVSVPLADKLVSFGLTGVYSYIKYDGLKVLSQFSMDAGVIVRPLEWLMVGFVAQNIFVGSYKNYMPRIIAVGLAAGSIKYGFNVMFDASFNISADDIPASGNYGIGAEYVLKQLVPIRLGYRYEGYSRHVMAVGLGYRHAEGLFGLDIAYQHHFNAPTNEIFSASINFYF